MLKYCCLIWLSLLCGPIPAEATDRYFNNLTTTSANGRYRVTAISPHNSPDSNGERYRRAFQHEFQYRLTVLPSESTAWTRAQGIETFWDDRLKHEWRFPAEPSPVDLFVSDGGWTVIRTQVDSLIVVGLDGRPHKPIELLDCFTDQELDQYALFTNAGTFWEEGSLWYFHELGGRPVFVVRTWWNRLFVVDLISGHLISTDDEPLLHEREHQFILGVVKSPADPKKSAWEIGPPGVSLQSSIYWAGIRNLETVVDDIRRWERFAEVNSFALSFGRDVPENGVNLNRWETSSLRQVCKTALRRLGVQPRRLPAIEFEMREGGHEVAWTAPPVTLSEQLENLPKVKVGMTPAEVFEHIGFPDFGDGDHWSYDIDDSPPFSLDITFKDDVVESIQRHETPKWQTDAREREVF